MAQHLADYFSHLTASATSAVLSLLSLLSLQLFTVDILLLFAATGPKFLECYSI
jgi:hypothetical protein